MTARGIITLVLVLVIVALGASAIFIFNKNKASQMAVENSTSTTAPFNTNNTNTVQGNVIFGIKGSIISGAVIISISKIEIHHQTQGWVTVSDKPNDYNLLVLKQSGATSLLAQGNVAVGTYDQIKLTISKVFVTRNAGQTEAKLPSGELKITANIIVEANKTSTIVFDFIANKSLHATSQGSFIFTPVIKLQTQSSTDATVNSNNQIHMTAGHTDANINVGMDADGQMKPDFIIGSNIVLSQVGNVIKIGIADEKDKTIKITASGAINLVLDNKYLDSVTSVALVLENGKKLWVVGGLKNLLVTSIYLDAVTGVVVTY